MCVQLFVREIQQACLRFYDLQHASDVHQSCCQHNVPTGARSLLASPDRCYSSPFAPKIVLLATIDYQKGCS